MAQVINTNVGALFAGAALNKSAAGLQVAQQRLSSGLRINSSKDDATGLGIATGYDKQVRGTNIAIRNASDAISKAQTNDGYGAQITENLQRLYEIAVQLGGTATGAETTALVAEREGRQWIGCELNPEYAAIAERRLRGVQRPLVLRGAA